MGTYADDSGLTSQLKPQTEKPELGFSSSGLNSHADEALIEKFQNVGLKPYDNEFNSDRKNYGDSDHDSTVLPLRPYAGDCLHYIRTGVCKFGLNCRFNHPVKRTALVAKDKERSLDKAGKIECKYYSTAGGCKYGNTCRYSHSKDESEIAVPQLNFLGLPIRWGGKECPYYMRNGSCGYGAQCVFHHPEPSSMGGQEPHKVSLNDNSMRQSGFSLGSSNSESASMHLSNASGPDQAPLSSQSLSKSTFSYQNDYSSHMIAKLIPQASHRHTELNAYQAQEFSHQSRHAHLNHGANRADMLERDISVQVEEFPERPGQPECAYFMKTGDCKFKSACKFDHPKGQPACVLNEKGLPLRPGRNICQHYERFGICKFGLACMFDHSVNNGFSTVQDWSSSESASGHDAGSWAEYHEAQMLNFPNAK